MRRLEVHPGAVCRLAIPSGEYGTPGRRPRLGKRQARTAENIARKRFSNFERFCGARFDRDDGSPERVGSVRRKPQATRPFLLLHVRARFRFRDRKSGNALAGGGGENRKRRTRRNADSRRLSRVFASGGGTRSCVKRLRGAKRRRFAGLGFERRRKTPLRRIVNKND